MSRPTQIGFTPVVVALLLQLVPLSSFSADRSYIAIIIDDLGHDRRAGERAINIQAHLTFAVLPKTQHAVRLASYAHSAGKEVMVHLPMENTMNKPLGGLALTRDLSEQDIAIVLDQAVRLVPFAKGINNHMGSALDPRTTGDGMAYARGKTSQVIFRRFPNDTQKRGIRNRDTGKYPNGQS